MTGERQRLLSDVTLNTSYSEQGRYAARKGSFSKYANNILEKGLPPLRDRVLTIGVLILLNFIILWNQFVINAVFPFVQSYFSVSDSSSGLLEATAAPLNAVCLLLYGALDGRYDRKRLIIGAMLFWSAMSVAASFVSETQFWLFCLLRAFHGIGAAALSTLTLPIIGEYLHGTGRGYAILFFTTSTVLAGTLSMSASSILVERGVSWQWLLRLPIPAVAAGLFILLFSMPNSQSASSRSPLSFGVALKNFYHLSRVRSYMYLLLMQCFLEPVIVSEKFWETTLLKRAIDMFDGTSNARVFHGMGFAAIMTLTSVPGAVVAVAGMIAGTALVDAWQQRRGCFRGCGRSSLRASALTISFFNILSIFLYLADLFLIAVDIIARTVAILGIGLATGVALPLYSTIVLDTVPIRQRALAFAIQPLLVALVRSPIPSILGAISDGLRGDIDDTTSRYYSLFWAMTGAGVLTLILAPLAHFMLVRHYASDVAAVQEEEGQAREIY